MENRTPEEKADALAREIDLEKRKQQFEKGFAELVKLTKIGLAPKMAMEGYNVTGQSILFTSQHAVVEIVDLKAMEEMQEKQRLAQAQVAPGGRQLALPEKKHVKVKKGK